jgi:2-oxoglutarate/2-oxoacid ferredoxin oxidoreductase subunit beta
MNKDKGIRMDGYTPKVVSLKGGEFSKDDLLVHNVKDSTLAFILSNMTYNDELPRPMGILQNIVKQSQDERIDQMIKEQMSSRGEGNLQVLLEGDSNWII